jgi:hypothetical protein
MIPRTSYVAIKDDCAKRLSIVNCSVNCQFVMKPYNLCLYFDLLKVYTNNLDTLFVFVTQVKTIIEHYLNMGPKYLVFCLSVCQSVSVFHNYFYNLRFIEDTNFKFDTGVYLSAYNNMYEFHYYN